jgi:hypothetical protein
MDEANMRRPEEKGKMRYFTGDGRTKYRSTTRKKERETSSYTPRRVLSTLE